MIENRPLPLDKRWVWTAAIGLAFFLLIQVFPISGQLFSMNTSTVLTRAEAEQRAIVWAADKFGVAASDINKTTVTHMTDSRTNGYLSKQALTGEYDKLWAAATPTDVYVVELYVNGTPGSLAVSLHMESGDLVAWRHVEESSGRDGDGPASEEKATADQAANALQYASSFGIRSGDWEWTGVRLASGGFEYASRQDNIGEAKLLLQVDSPSTVGSTPSASWQGGTVAYRVELPKSFIDYMDN